ncbi:PR5-like receptor kinase [Macadamia integrifolia]|uniref:PR5-like receptor kinase n=1 Tax=Macadamia integrifolia TaxID=60698 RepID=UPI001C4EEB86|nr:PR5-like receptor kinase [Macadamia integrifolia]
MFTPLQSLLLFKLTICWSHHFAAARGTRSWGKKLVIVIVPSTVFVIILLGILRRRKLLSNEMMSFSKKRTRNTQNVEVFLRNFGSLAPKRYSYSDIKKMTNSFKEKLGQGGYGGVFKGNLPNGRLVAVKVLNASKGNGEEFINEVASISRTSHVNIVTLLGFCFDGSKRALIYDFMSNGSLEKFIYNKKSVETSPNLGWERLYQIAVGIAQGLEYLHRGCNTRILHFDIKPHNILLDEDFCPKISDFGLAKLCPRKDSIISMADARGTIGYIAPEVFSRNFGGVSHKSDVYSYGMMVLEMVGGRRNIDAGVDHTSEIYFPHWIYKQIGQGEHLQLDMVMREEDEEIAKKMVLVGLWCIQMDPTNRPSIRKVVDMLEGSLESLPIPPKPVFSSPPRQVADSFTGSSS